MVVIVVVDVAIMIVIVVDEGIRVVVVVALLVDVSDAEGVD